MESMSWISSAHQRFHARLKKYKSIHIFTCKFPRRVHSRLHACMHGHNLNFPVLPIRRMHRLLHMRLVRHLAGLKFTKVRLKQIKYKFWWQTWVETFSHDPNITSSRGTCRIAWNFGIAHERLEPEVAICQMDFKKCKQNTNFNQILPARSGKTSFRRLCSLSPSCAISRICDSDTLDCLALKYHDTKSSRISQNLGQGSRNPSGNCSRRWGFLSQSRSISLNSGSIRFCIRKGSDCTKYK